MYPEISGIVMFMRTDKEIWNAFKLNYSKVKDVAQVYKINVES